jgi:hypothetical protein
MELDKIASKQYSLFYDGINFVQLLLTSFVCYSKQVFRHIQKNCNMEMFTKKITESTGLSQVAEK